MSLLWKLFLTFAVWVGFIAAWIAICLWYRHRKALHHLTHAEEWAESELDDLTGVGMILLLAGLLFAIVTLAVPSVATWQIWGGGDGCRKGMHSIETGNYTPIVVKGVTYFIPETVCVLD